MTSSYRKIWENYHNKKLDPNIEIHHIDGDHSNNSPLNLKAVSIQEHLQEHLDQEDYGAVQAILMRMDRTDYVKELIKLAASKHQKYLWANDCHNFQKLSKEERSAISKQAGYKTLELKLGIHAINADPIKSIENARKGGLAAAHKKAGFLNTESANHGSKHVKGTKWWVNSEGSRVRSIEAPGPGWVRGMKYNESKINKL